jgi:DNA replication and repair protein RecF
LDLPPGIVVLFGRNAQGKTSLLEAIYLLAIARSFRAENEHEMVNWQAAGEEGGALVSGTIEKLNERLRVYIGYQYVPTPESKSRPFGVRRQISVSRVKRTAAELVGLVNAVLFNAEDIELVQGAPSFRRRYLDILMSQVDPPYVKSLQRYQRVLHQRNRLLRLLSEGRAGEDELAFWNEELAKEGSWIVEQRHKAMALLATLCHKVHGELTGAAEELKVKYRPNVPRYAQVGSVQETQQEFMAALDSSRARELRLSSTVVGPHRDDFELLVNDVDMGTYASRGQARTLALSLRLAEAAYLSSAREEGPIVLLDDVLSEMDSSRRSHVLDKVAQYRQVIITTTDLEPIRKSSLAIADCLQVEGGNVSRAAPQLISP